jgi:high-affinity Fe2+/Pb2+ permease
VEDILVFDDGMVSIKDITQLRLSNGTAKAFGRLFSGFGAGWLLFGGVAQIAGDYEFTWGTFAIGAVAVGLGWILNKFVSKKTYKMGKNANLRIIDISFSLTPVPTVQTNGGYP